MKRVLFICFLLWTCLEASGQSKLSLYTQKYLSELNDTLINATRIDKATENVAAYIHVEPDIDLAVLEELGVKVNLFIEDIITARIPVANIEKVAETDKVSYVQVAIPVHPMMDKVRQASGIDKVQNGEGLSGPFYGKGVVVGIIDAGFDYTHPDFYDWDRKTLRIRRVWEQNYTDGTAPEGFSYGGEFKTQEEILKAAGDVDTNSHGTHVAGIAAGADKLDNTYYGVAGEADIVLVSMGTRTENNVNLSDAIAYIYRYAESVNKPCVINMSLGTQSGPHDGTSTFDVIADKLQGEGRLLVGSVGNFGGGKFHTSRTFASSEDEPLKTFVHFKSQLSTTHMGGDIEIWGEQGMKYSVEIFTYDLYNLKKAETVTVDFSATEQMPSEFKLKGAIGMVQVFPEISPLNNKPHVMLSSQLTSLKTNYALGLEVIPHTAGTVHIWGDDIYVDLSSNDLEGWADGDNLLSLAEIGGTGKNILSVGAFVTRNSYHKEGSDQTFTLKETLDSIASFSSKGPTADGRMKPEITAPGCYVVSAASSHDTALSSLDIASHGTWNDGNYYYAYMQGTSMAAPVVTGILATWLQANPRLTPQNVRDILKKTASQDKYTAILPDEGSPTWGYGKIDAWNGLKESLSLLSSICTKAEAPPSTILTKKGSHAYSLLFTREASGVSYTVYSACGQSIKMRLSPSVDVAEEMIIELFQCPKGIYIIRINTDKWQNTHKLVIE